MPDFVKLSVSAVALVLIIFMSIPANAEVVAYGDYQGYALGKGILGLDYADPKASCMTYTPGSVSRNKADVRVSIVYSDSDYDRAFDVDQSAKASYLTFSGHDEFHIADDLKNAQTAFSVVIEAYAQHDSPTVNNVVLSEPYADELASKDPAKIESVRQACGDRFVETQFLDSRLFVVLNVLQGSSLSTLSAKFASGGKIGISAVEASGDLGGDLAITNTRKTGGISLSVKSIGFGNASVNAGAIGIATGDSLSDIAQKTLQFLTKDPTLETGTAVGYQLEAIPNMPQRSLTDALVLGRLAQLKQIFDSASADQQNVNALLSGSDPRVGLLNHPADDIALTNYLKASLKNA